MKIEHGSKMDKIFIKSRFSNSNMGVPNIRKGVPNIRRPMPKIDCITDKKK